MEWPALESDPEIFNRYFHNLGLESEWEFTEIYEMSEEIMCSGLVLAYRRQGDWRSFEGEPFNANFFIKQVKKLDNACGLLAGLHCILNSCAGIAEGSLLEQLRDNIIGQPPEVAAQWLVGHDSLKKAHQSFANEGQTSVTHKPKHHFIALLPGMELYDGTKESPVKLGDFGFTQEFFTIIRDSIESNRIGPDINLMALQNLTLL